MPHPDSPIYSTLYWGIFLHLFPTFPTSRFWHKTPSTLIIRHLTKFIDFGTPIVILFSELANEFQQEN